MTLNSIACEHCRAKKCKCDRRLPYCSQCQASSLSCRYTKGGKRGIPTAYINSLEDRLAETEAALYSALEAVEAKAVGSGSTISRLHVDGRMLTLRDRSKAEKQDEWKRLPLRSGEQLQTWYEQKKPPTKYEAQQQPTLHSSFQVSAHPSITQNEESEYAEPRQQPQHANGAVEDLSDSIEPNSTLNKDTTNRNTHVLLSAQLQNSAQWRNYF